MQTSVKKSSTTTTATARQATNQPFFAKAGGGDFFSPVKRTAVSAIQLKMTVNKPGDSFEQEADKMAGKVMRMPAPASPAKEEKIQKAPPAEEKIRKQEKEKIQKAPAAEEKLQRKSSDGTPAIGANVQSAIKSRTTGGQPLSSDVRSYMEPRFNADFSNVRIHSNAESASLSNQLSARAFTYQNNVFFSRNQYQPGTSEGKHLLAHELTHTIQQGHAVQRTPQITTTTTTPPPVQRFGLQDAWDKFAELANLLPGFRMFTIILGVNPINMTPVVRNAANILRALVEFMPGGGLITLALDQYGVFEKAGSWVEQQIQALGLVGGAIKQSVTQFLDTLKWSDIFDLGGVWNRAQSIFTDPINRIISLAKSMALGILKFIKDAILMPLARLAEGTAGWDLLCAVLGQNPITGDPVPRTADTLIGGFMKLIGQEEIWQNIKRGNAVARAWAWFQGALSELLGFVRQIPGLFMQALQTLQIADLVQLPSAFARVAVTFGSFIGKFMSWAGNTVWNLLEIIFDSVKPGLMGYIKKTGAALKSILKNPLPFVGNLVNTAKLGFQNFAANFGGHLKTGLIDWLTGSLAGVYIPKALSLPELGKFALSVLGITWVQIRGKIVKALGPKGETIMKGLETGFDIVMKLVSGGPAAAWELLKEKLTDLKDAVISGIVGFVTETIIMKAIPKLIAMFIPGAGFISAIISIYDTIMVFVQKISKIIQVVAGFIDSIVTIAGGNISAAANRVESVLGGLLSLAISFLAGFLGLGKVTDKIMEVIGKVRATVNKAIDTAITWVVGKAKALFARLFSKKDKPDERTPEQKQADLDKAIGEAQVLQKRPSITEQHIKKELPAIKQKYKMQSLKLVVESQDNSKETVHIEGSINPDGKTTPISIPKELRLTKVEEHVVTAPPFPDGTDPKLMKGASHHVPVKVLKSWFAVKLDEAANIASDLDLKSSLKAKANFCREKPEGEGLSAIWLQEELHVAIHGGPPAMTVPVMKTKKGATTTKPMKSTIEHNFPGAVQKADTDEVNPDTEKMQGIFNSAFAMALTMGKATVAGLDLPGNPVPDLEIKAVTWNPYKEVPRKK